MDFPRDWKHESVGHVRDFGGYLERSVPPWGWLWCNGHRESEVGGFEPYTGSRFESFETRCVFDPGSLRFTLCLLGGFPGVLDGLDATLEAGIDGFTGWLMGARGVSYQ